MFESRAWVLSYFAADFLSHYKHRLGMFILGLMSSVTYFSAISSSMYWPYIFINCLIELHEKVL